MNERILLIFCRHRECCSTWLQLIQLHFGLGSESLLAHFSLFDMFEGPLSLLPGSSLCFQFSFALSWLIYQRRTFWGRHRDWSRHCGRSWERGRGRINLCTNNNSGEKINWKRNTWNYWLSSVPFWAVTGIEGWGAEDEPTDFFPFPPSCAVLSSFFSLPFFCCFFSFLKRCFSSFVNSCPSFYFAKHWTTQNRSYRRSWQMRTRTFARPTPSSPWELSAKPSTNKHEFNHTVNRRLRHNTPLNIPNSTAKTTQTSRSVTLGIRASNSSYS